MRAYRIEVAPNDKTTPYHIYIRQSPVSCCGLTLFSSDFMFYTKYERAKEAEEDILARGDTSQYQGFFMQGRRIDITQAMLLTGEQQNNEKLKPHSQAPRINGLN